MSLTYVSSITPASATLRDGCTDETNNEVIIVESSTPTLRRYNLSTGLQVGSSWGTSSAPSCVSLVAPSIAAIGYSGTSFIDFMNVTTGFRLSGAAGTTTSTVKGQLMAADLSAQVGFMSSSTARQYFKFDYGAGGAVTSFTNSYINQSSAVNCVILKSSGRWLMGTTFGQIFEVDTTGAIIDIMDAGNSPNAGLLSVSTNTSNPIMYMSYSDNLLLVTYSNGARTLIDWSTKTVLQQLPGGASTGGVVLCAAASGITVAGRNITSAGTANNPLYEMDFTVQPVRSANPLFTDSTSAIIASGINTSTGRGWALQSTPRIRIFDIAPRASTTQAVSFQPFGSHVKCALRFIDDTGGAGNEVLLLDTVMQSPGTYRLPTGKSIIATVTYGEGATAVYNASRITT